MRVIRSHMRAFTTLESHGHMPHTRFHKCQIIWLLLQGGDSGKNLVRMTFYDFPMTIRRYGLRPAFGRPQPVHDPETAFGRPQPVHEGCVFGTWFGAKPFNERVQNRLQKWAHSFLGSLTYARSCTKFGGLAPCHNQCFPIAKSSRKHCNFNGKCARLRA